MMKMKDNFHWASAKDFFVTLQNDTRHTHTSQVDDHVVVNERMNEWGLGGIYEDQWKRKVKWFQNVSPFSRLVGWLVSVLLIVRERQ